MMPNYPWLQKNHIDADETIATMKGMKMVGVPYTDDDFAAAAAGVKGKTEMDAMVAYLQVLGTMIHFNENVDYRE